MVDITILLARLISYAIDAYIFVIVVRAIISWVNPDPYNPIVRALYRLTEPVLYPIRRMLSRSIGNRMSFRSMGGVGIDFSPFVAIILLLIFRRVLLGMLF